MSELWETLTTGLIVSLLFIGVSYFFWRRYDKPTPLMIERQEEKARLREEQRTWREVEARMRAENEEAELKAAYERRKAEERARAAVPVSSEVNDAWKSLGVSPLEKEATTTFTAEGEDANAANRASDQSSLTDEVTGGDDDVLNVAELVQVRQDAGVQAGAEEPDWELIEKLHEIAEQDDVEVPDVPAAPDLDIVAADLDAQEDGEHGKESTADEPGSDNDAPSQPVEHEGEAGEKKSVTPALSAEADAPPPSASNASSDIVTWNLAEGEDLWDGTSWEEE